MAEARVDVGGATVGQSGPGVLLFVCAMSGDDSAVAEKLAAKVCKLRIFSDEVGKMNLSLRDVGGSALIISQFTLAADTSRGNRPGFSAAAPPSEGRTLFEAFVAAMKAEGIACETGEFGADMQVSLINDGPATFWIDSAS